MIDNEAVIQSIDVIAIHPKVRNGRPCIAGTTIEVTAIVIQKIVHDQTPEEIAADYHLTLPQVYGALAYYYDHKAEMDVMMEARRTAAKALKEQRVDSRT